MHVSHKILTEDAVHEVHHKNQHLCHGHAFVEIHWPSHFCHHLWEDHSALIKAISILIGSQGVQ